MSNLPVPSGGWNTSIATKQRERDSTAPPDDNQPEIGAIIAEEDRLFENSRKAGVEIQKATQRAFKAWMTFALGVRAARNRADRLKGKKVFEHILAQERLDKVLGNTPASIKSTASRLLKILEHEAAVMLWRAGLSDYERMQWSSPASVCSRCPALKFKGEPGEARAETEKKPTSTERIRALEADNAHLREELARYDTSEPAQKPGKIKGLQGFLDAWKPLREALKDTPPEERLKVLTRLQDEIRGEIAGLTEPAETPAPAPKQKRVRRKKAEIEAKEEAERAKATSEREPTEEEQLAKSLDLAASVEAAREAGNWPPPTPAEAAQVAASPGLTLMERKRRLSKMDPHDPEMWDKVDSGEMTLEEAERELGLA
jgi:hypothetical protein